MTPTPDITIREDFRDLIPPLNKAELDQLRASIETAGKARDPLVVWKGKNILLDGHNRYAFCKERGFGFTVVEQRCSNVNTAKNWIILNQLSRRNLAPKAASILRGKLYHASKQAQGGDRKSKHQNDVLINTAETVASKTGVSKPTVERDAKFAESVETLGIEQEVMSGENTQSRSEIIAEAEKVKPTPSKKKTAKPSKVKPLRDRVCSKLTKLLSTFPDSERNEVINILRDQLA